MYTLVYCLYMVNTSSMQIDIQYCITSPLAGDGHFGPLQAGLGAELLHCLLGLHQLLLSC